MDGQMPLGYVDKEAELRSAWPLGTKVRQEDEYGATVFTVTGYWRGNVALESPQTRTTHKADTRHLTRVPSRYAPCAVFGGALGTQWRVIDRETNRYVPTLPSRFVARESAQAAADNLNR